MARIRRNLQNGILGVALTSGDTTITFAEAPGFPTLGAEDYVPIAIDGKEIVHLTDYTLGATTGTITRGEEGSTAVAHDAGAPWRHGVLVADVEDVSGGGGGGDGGVTSYGSPGNDAFGVPGFVLENTTSQWNLVANQWQISPMLLHRPMVFDALEVEVYSTSPGAEFTVLVYEADMQWECGSLVFQSPIGSMASAGDQRVSFPSNLELPAGRYVAVPWWSNGRLRIFEGTSKWILPGTASNTVLRGWELADSPPTWGDSPPDPGPAMGALASGASLRHTVLWREVA